MGTGQENRMTEALKFQDVNHTLTLSLKFRNQLKIGKCMVQINFQ